MTTAPCSGDMTTAPAKPTSPLPAATRSAAPANGSTRRRLRRGSVAIGVAVVLAVLVVASIGPAGPDSPTAGWLVLSGPAVIGLVAAGGPSDVDRLVEGVERIAAGDYDVDFGLDRDDDLGRIASALDA